MPEYKDQPNSVEPIDEWDTPEQRRWEASQLAAGITPEQIAAGKRREVAERTVPVEDLLVRAKTILDNPASVKNPGMELLSIAQVLARRKKAGALLPEQLAFLRELERNIHDIGQRGDLWSSMEATKGPPTATAMFGNSEVGTWSTNRDVQFHLFADADVAKHLGASGILVATQIRMERGNAAVAAGGGDEEYADAFYRPVTHADILQKADELGMHLSPEPTAARVTEKTEGDLDMSWHDIN
jgi:hypothetical protein